MSRRLVLIEKKKSSKIKENDSRTLQLGKGFHWIMGCGY